MVSFFYRNGNEIYSINTLIYMRQIDYAKIAHCFTIVNHKIFRAIKIKLKITSETAICVS